MASPCWSCWWSSSSSGSWSDTSRHAISARSENPRSPRPRPKSTPSRKRSISTVWTRAAIRRRSWDSPRWSTARRTSPSGTARTCAKTCRSIPGARRTCISNPANAATTTSSPSARTASRGEPARTPTSPTTRAAPDDALRAQGSQPGWTGRVARPARTRPGERDSAGREPRLYRARRARPRGLRRALARRTSALSTRPVQPGVARAAQGGTSPGRIHRNARRARAPQRIPRRAREHSLDPARGKFPFFGAAAVSAGLSASLRLHRAGEREDERPRSGARALRRLPEPARSDPQAPDQRGYLSGAPHRRGGPGEPFPAALRGATLQPDLRGTHRRVPDLLEAPPLMRPVGGGSRGSRDRYPCRPRDRGGIRAAERSNQGADRERAVETARDRRAPEAVPACAFLPHHR